MVYYERNENGFNRGRLDANLRFDRVPSSLVYVSALFVYWLVCK